MIWYDMIWYDMIWYDMIWYDMIWYDMICYIWYMMWYMIYDDMIWYDLWYDIWYDMVWYMIWYNMIFVLNAIGLQPGGSSTVHIYIQTIHRTTQNKHYIEQHNNFGRLRAVPRLYRIYPDICLTT